MPLNAYKLEEIAVLLSLYVCKVEEVAAMLPLNAYKLEEIAAMAGGLTAKPSCCPVLGCH